jgi:hypothetical protein
MREPVKDLTDGGSQNASRRPATAEPGARKPRRQRPDPKPSRLVVGAGAIAALSIIGAGLVRFPANADDAVAGQTAVAAPAKGSKAASKRPVKFVRLKPGQKAPAGAKVIRKKAPPPRIVVIRAGTATVTSSRSSSARKSPTTRQRPKAPVAPKPVIKTRQSG